VLIIALIASIGLTAYCVWAEANPPEPVTRVPTPVTVTLDDDDDPPTVVQIRRG
jgi:hypothetical protein